MIPRTPISACLIVIVPPTKRVLEKILSIKLKGVSL